EHFRDDLRYGRPDAAADVSDAGAALDAAVVVDEHFGGRRRSVEVVPDALREPDAALHRPRVRARFHLARLCPADLLRADAALLAPRRMRIVPVAQLERIHPQPVRERVDGLLEPEGALWVPWRAERRRRSGMQEYVGLLDVHHLGGVDVLHRPRAAGPRGAARAAKRVEAQRGELSLLG